MKNKLTTSDVRDIFKNIKPHFTSNLGKYTHQRIAWGWHFHGLAYVRDEMTYVFGFYIGFFKGSNKSKYNNVGMNVLVRTSGENEELRNKYVNFFRKKLKYWNYREDTYKSHRGGGIEFERYKKIEEFNNNDEIIYFLKESITELHKIYPEIIKNEDNIFDDVLRASYPWFDTIIDVSAECVENQE